MESTINNVRIFGNPLKPVVLNRGGERSPMGGSANKFPGGREPLRALQHGKFDPEIYQQINLLLKPGGLKQRTVRGRKNVCEPLS